jgi:hypothetical protein
MQPAKLCDIYYAYLKIRGNRDSSVGIATSWTTVVRLPAEAGISLYSTSSRPTRGSTQPPIQWAPAAVSLGVNRQGREADHSPPSNAEVKKSGAIPALSHRDFTLFYLKIRKWNKHWRNSPISEFNKICRFFL